MKRIVPVTPGKYLGRFIDFPHELYRNDPNYVPELFVAQKDMLTPGKHPFYKHSEVQLFLAYDDDRITGRVAAILNHNHNAFTGNKDGFFGFFDCINDQETANMLLITAADWLKTRHADTLIGPVNLSTNDTCGLLVEGFDSPPMVMMTYNAPYYEQLLLNSGFVKKTDLLAYIIDSETADDKPVRLLDVLQGRLKRNGITIRQINLKDFKNEAAKVHTVYNKAWDKNLGFVPMTKEEFEHTAKDLKMILDPKYCLVAEKDNQLVGFALGIPNINEIQINIKRGRLLPTGIFKLLFQRKKIGTIRVLMLGVLEGYRKMGIEACLYGNIIKNGTRSNIKRAECSWMLENNYLMNHAIEQINGRLYKRYRLYEKPL